MGGDINRSRVGALTRAVTYARWQPDKWERLHVLADLARPATSVLDVGGRGVELATLLPDADVVTVNVRPPADVVYAGHGLPFPDDSFDVVTSSDVLEHIPPDQRHEHVAELARVARSHFVIGCPLGSEAHAASELRIASTIRTRYGLRLDFLEEHIELGLPTAADLQALVLEHVPDAKLELWYHSDFSKGEQMLVDGVAARWGHDPRALVRLLRDSYLTPRATDVAAAPSPTTNRVYAVVHLELMHLT